jgi:hypothetical protein
MNWIYSIKMDLSYMHDVPCVFSPFFYRYFLAGRLESNKRLPVHYFRRSFASSALALVILASREAAESSFLREALSTLYLRIRTWWP